MHAPPLRKCGCTTCAAATPHAGGSDTSRPHAAAAAAAASSQSGNADLSNACPARACSLRGSQHAQHASAWRPLGRARPRPVRPLQLARAASIEACHAGHAACSAVSCSQRGPCGHGLPTRRRPGTGAACAFHPSVCAGHAPHVMSASAVRRPPRALHSVNTDGVPALLAGVASRVQRYRWLLCLWELLTAGAAWSPLCPCMAASCSTPTTLASAVQRSTGATH